MAKTITQLPDATTVGAADEMIIQQSGVTKRATIDELKTQVAALGARDVTVSAANRSITNTGNFALSFGTNNTERVRITENGILQLLSALGEGGQLEIANPDNATAGLIIDVSSANVARVWTPSTTTGDLQIGQLSGTGGITRFFTAGTERMRIDASGNVGINTNSPSRYFHVVVVAAPAANANQKTGLLIQNSDGTGTSGSPNTARIQFAYDPASPRAYIEGGTLGNDLLAFGFGTTEHMRIDGSGNVGIGGTANAAAILDAASTTKGFLPPRMTTAERDAISTPPAGLVLYNTSTNKLQVRTNTAWADLH
jgi:hypothetical protein